VDGVVRVEAAVVIFGASLASLVRRSHALEELLDNDGPVEDDPFGRDSA
jgi:hypothetical protein